jgi:hypothetical protein
LIHHHVFGSLGGRTSRLAWAQPSSDRIVPRCRHRRLKPGETSNRPSVHGATALFRSSIHSRPSNLLVRG